MPHSNAHRPTTRSTHKPHPDLPQGEGVPRNHLKHNKNELQPLGDSWKEVFWMAVKGLPISSCFFTANGGLFLRPRAAFFTVAAAVVMQRMTVGMVETARRKTRFPTVGTTSHAKAKPTATATAFCIYVNLL